MNGVSDSKSEGPQFLPRLWKMEISVSCISGNTYEGILVGFNRYEILIREQNAVAPRILMKHSIESITPLDPETDFSEDPFKGD